MIHSNTYRDVFLEARMANKSPLDKALSSDLKRDELQRYAETETNPDKKAAAQEMLTQFGIIDQKFASWGEWLDDAGTLQMGKDNPNDMVSQDLDGWLAQREIGVA